MRAPRPLDWLPEAWLFAGLFTELVYGSLQPGPIIAPRALAPMAFLGFYCWLVARR